MSVPPELRYTKEHEWLRLEGDEATVGITAYATEQLGDIVFVELPKVGRSLDQFATFGVVESVKAVSDLYAPISGEVVAVNEALADRPELVNQDPYGAGWLAVVEAADWEADRARLLDPPAYFRLTKGQAEAEAKRS